MEITGRVTADAKVKFLDNDRQVVNFTIAINDYIKPKGGEGKQVTTYVNCSYWRSSKVAERLTKGALVLVTGRIGMQAYNDMQGNAKGSLTFHTNSINILATPKNKPQEGQQPYAHAAQNNAGNNSPETVDDLPF